MGSIQDSTFPENFMEIRPVVFLHRVAERQTKKNKNNTPLPCSGGGGSNEPSEFIRHSRHVRREHRNDHQIRNYTTASQNKSGFTKPNTFVNIFVRDSVS